MNGSVVGVEKGVNPFFLKIKMYYKARTQTSLNMVACKGGCVTLYMGYNFEHGMRHPVKTFWDQHINAFFDILLFPLSSKVLLSVFCHYIYYNCKVWTIYLLYENVFGSKPNITHFWSFSFAQFYPFCCKKRTRQRKTRILLKIGNPEDYHDRGIFIKKKTIL